MQAHNKSLVYYTSWNVNQDANYDSISQDLTHLNLSFGRLAKDNEKFIIRYSDALLKYGFSPLTGDSWWLEPEYLKWTDLKYSRPHLKVLLAFGGATYEEMWSYFEDAANLSGIVDAIRGVLSMTFPVYRKNAEGIYKEVARVKLDGVDFDFELAGKRPSDNQCANLARLISRIKTEIHNNALVTLTGYHVSADPIACQWGGSTETACSYAGSTHCGELIRLLQAINMEHLDLYNLMAYDAGKHYPWQLAMRNHAQYIPKEKMLLGLSLGSQWDPTGSFVEDFSEITRRIVEQKALGYPGIMVWAITPDGVPGNTGTFIEKVNQMLTILNG